MRTYSSLTVKYLQQSTMPQCVKLYQFICFCHKKTVYIFLNKTIRDAQKTFLS